MKRKAGKLGMVLFGACYVTVQMPKLADAASSYFPLGFGSAGIPDSFAIENYTSYQTVAGHPIGNLTELAYFSKTGVTGNTRDQFEFFTFFSEGHSDPLGQAAYNGGTGIGNPILGTDYFYNFIVPKKVDPDSSEYVTFWTNPSIQVNFPNGDNAPAGFGSGGNQYSFNFNLENYIRIGKFGITIVPIFLTYFRNNLSPISSVTPTGVLQSVNLRGGLSISTAIVNLEYHLTKDWWAGVYHQLNLNNVSYKSLNFGPSTTEGTLGPAVEYDGFAKYNLYVQGTVQFDYYHSANLKNNTSFILYFFKYLNKDKPAPANDANSGN